jgi:hypothetical protein
MKLLFNLEIVAGNRIHARPVEYSQSLSPAEQHAAVTELLARAKAGAHDNQDPQARTETEIGIATAQESLEKLPPVIFTGDRGETSDD